MTQLVDDQLLSLYLRTGESRGSGQLYTSGCWYVRLCQAVLSATERDGTLSAPFRALPPEAHERAVAALLELPDEVGLVSLRTLAPRIGQLRRRHQLNLLGSEALAAAVHLKADVHLSVSSPRLEDALRAEGRAVWVTEG